MFEKAFSGNVRRERSGDWTPQSHGEVHVRRLNTATSFKDCSALCLREHKVLSRILVTSVKHSVTDLIQCSLSGNPRVLRWRLSMMTPFCRAQRAGWHICEILSSTHPRKKKAFFDVEVPTGTGESAPNCLSDDGEPRWIHFLETAHAARNVDGVNFDEHACDCVAVTEDNDIRWNNRVLMVYYWWARVFNWQPGTIRLIGTMMGHLNRSKQLYKEPPIE